MFIDYVTVMLANVVAGLFVLSAYVWTGLGSPDQRSWAPAFGAVGLVGVPTGLHMIFTWPLPGSYNFVFGEMSLLFGAAFLAAAVALAMRQPLFYVGLYGVVAGAASVLVGVRVLHLEASGVMQFSRNPMLTGVGFLTAGASGVLLLWALYRRTRASRALVCGLLLTSAAIWAFTAGMGYWAHVRSFAEWKP